MIIYCCYRIICKNMLLENLLVKGILSFDVIDFFIVCEKGRINCIMLEILNGIGRI